jgi:phage shock protein C
MLAGVAGGLAEMWDADPSLVRIVWALLALFTGGIALVVYIVMAIVVPERPEPWSPASPVTTAATDPVAATGLTRAEARAARAAARAARRADRRHRGPSGVAIVVGGFLVVVGAIALVRQWLPEFELDWLWPVALIALGVLVLVAAIERGHDAEGRSQPTGTSAGPGASDASGGPIR